MSNTRKTGTRASGSDFLSRITARHILIGVIVVLAVWFIFANTGDTKVTFWIPTVEAPLWIVLAGTFIVGGAFGWMLCARRKSKQ